MKHEGLGLLFVQRRSAWQAAAFGIMQSKQDTEEVVQQAVYAAVHAGADLSDQVRGERYVYKAVRTKALDHVRMRGQTVRLCASEAAAIPSLDLDPEQRLLAQERQQQFERALELLTPDQRRAIRLFLRAKNTRQLSALSKQTGIPISTLRSRILAGLKTIKERIGGDV